MKIKNKGFISLLLAFSVTLICITRQNSLLWVFDNGHGYNNNHSPESMDMDHKSVKMTQYGEREINHVERSLDNSQNVVFNNTVGRIGSEEVVLYDHRYLENFSGSEVGQVSLRFLNNFQSPCIIEKANDNAKSINVYRNNKMVQGPYYSKKSCFVSGLLSANATYMKYPNHSSTMYRLRCFPHFMVLGVAKSGTTDLTSRMLIHPMIHRGMSKELYWWDHYRFTLKSTLSDYSDLLDKGVGEMVQNVKQNTEDNSKPYYPGVLGEMTSITLTDNAYWRDDQRNKGLKEPKYLTPHDVYALNPHVKLIVIMRNPTFRLYSHYVMFTHRHHPSKGPENFHEKVLNSIKWWEECNKVLPLRGCLYGSPPEMPPVEHELKSWWPENYNYSGTLRVGLYYFHIQEWFSVFPRENFLFIRSEDYSKDKLSVMNNHVFPFLGVPKAEDIDANKIKTMQNKNRRHYTPILNATIEVLDNFYRTYNMKLAKLLGDDKWTWNDS